jgi:hypothetical protein
MFKADIQAYIEYLGMSIGYIPKKLSIYGMSIGYIPKKLSIYGMGIGYIPISYPIPNKKVFQNFKCFKKKKHEKKRKNTTRSRHDHGTITHRTHANPPRAKSRYFHCIK